MYNSGNLTVTDTVFSNNTLTGYNSYGGAIYAKYSKSMNIKDTVFSFNAALGDYDYGQGGAVYANDVSNVTIINTIFADNVASGDSSAGGAIWIAGDDVTIENNTFMNNSAKEGAAICLSTVKGQKVVGKEWVDGYTATDYSTLIYDYIGGVQVGSHYRTYWVEGYYKNIYGDVLIGNNVKINNNIFKSNSANGTGNAIIDHGTNTQISSNLNDTISVYSSTIYVYSNNTIITNNEFDGGKNTSSYTNQSDSSTEPEKNSANSTNQNTFPQPQNNENNTAPDDSQKPDANADNSDDTITVKKNIKITASEKTFKRKVKTKKYTVTVKSGKKAAENLKLKLKVNGKTYKAVTNKKGKATFKITKLTKKGTFKATISCKGDSNYNKASKTVKIKCR